MKSDIEINKAELAHIREYLTAQRRGSNYSFDAGDTIIAILRRVGFSAALELLEFKERKPGQCVVCGCTEQDACPPGCSWADDQGETVCDTCAEA